MGQAKRKKLAKLADTLGSIPVKIYQDSYIDNIEVNTAEHIAVELTRSILAFDDKDFGREETKAVVSRSFGMLWYVSQKYSCNEDIVNLAGSLMSAFTDIEISHTKETDSKKLEALVGVQVLLHYIKEEEKND